MASFSDPDFPAAVARASGKKNAGNISSGAVRRLVESLSGWAEPVESAAGEVRNIVVQVKDREELGRLTAIGRRFPEAKILIWTNATLAAELRAAGTAWRVEIHSDDAIADGQLRLAHLESSLPEELRNSPQSLMFVLAEGTVVDASGLDASSPWLRVRILLIDQILGAMRVMTVQQRSVLDRIADHLVAAVQA